MTFALKRYGSKARALTYAIVALASGAICPATAQTTAPSPSQPGSCSADMQPEMTFTAYTSRLGQRYGAGTREYIFADGFICPDTAEKFRQFLAQNPPKAPNTIVVLNSGGGSLGAGIQLGEIIRQQKMWTQVGALLPLMIPQNQNIPPQNVAFLSEPAAPPFAGECASACTLTFMGGVVRTIGYASNYAVHQFEGGDEEQSATEKESAAIVKYLSEMGISPNYMTYMVLKTGNDVTDLTMQQLRDLNIITPHWRSTWQISPRSDNSGFVLNGITTDAWGTQEIDIACGPKETPTSSGGPTPGAGSAPRPGAGSTPAAPKQPALTAEFFLDPGPRAKAQDVANAVKAIDLQLSGLFVPLSLSAKPGDIKVVSNRLVAGLTFKASLVPLIEKSPQIGIAFTFDPAAKLPMRLLKFEADLNTALLTRFAKTCQ